MDLPEAFHLITTGFMHMLKNPDGHNGVKALILVGEPDWFSNTTLIVCI